MKILNVVLVFLFLMPLSLAYSYDSFHTEVELIEGQAYVDTQLHGAFSTELLLSLPPSIEELHVFVDNREISCTVSEEEISTKLTCSLEEGLHFVQILYRTTSSLLSLSEENTAFQWKENISTEDFLFILKLPEQSTLLEQQLLIPEPERIYFDGRRTVLLWEEKSFEEMLSISVLYQEKTLSFPWYLLSIPLILLILALYLWKGRKKDIFVSGALLENEKKLLTILKENNKQLWQKQLELKSGLSKVKLSRLIQSMEKRGIVRKEPYGASNIIHLVEENKPE